MPEIQSEHCEDQATTVPVKVRQNRPRKNNSRWIPKLNGQGTDNHEGKQALGETKFGVKLTQR